MVTPGMTLPAPQDDPRAARLQRVRRQSGVMATTSAAIIILLGVVMLLYWCLTPADMLFRHAGLVLPPPTEVAFTTRLAAFTVAMIPLGALIVGLLSARRCFACFAVGRIYSGRCRAKPPGIRARRRCVGATQARGSPQPDAQCAPTDSHA